MKREAALLLLVLAVPLLVGATDPPGDVTTCANGRPTPGPDLVEAEGSATELGTVASWRLTFDRPVQVPSDLRIDILVRDPRLAPESLGDERGMNRIVRWEATSADRPIEIIWLPHDGSTSFNPPVVDGRTVVIVAPGRLLLGESVNGTESVERARWNVVVSAGGACDSLDSGVPVQRLPTATGLPPTPVASTQSPSAPSAGQGSSIFRVPIAIVLFCLAAVPFWLYRRRTVEGGSSSGPV